MVVGSATVALVVACFLTVLEGKIKSWRKNGCKIKCLCKHEYDVQFVNIIHRDALLKCRKCGKKKRIKNLSHEAIDKLWQVEEMKIIGNKESVNQISLTHKGINARFNCFMKPFPYCNDIDTSNPEIIEIIFKDSYEIDNLIDVLEKFKKECFEHLGEWR